MTNPQHAFATVLLACMGGAARKAALRLTEGLVAGIEHRLALYAAKRA